MNIINSSSVKSTLWLLLGVGVLNFALSFHNLWPTPWVTARRELSVEVAIVLLALSLFSEWRGIPDRRWLRALSVIFMLFVVARYAEVTAPSLFGRRINVYWDAQHLPQLAAMFAGSAAWWKVLATLAGVCVMLLATYTALYLSLKRVWVALASNASRRALACVSATCVGLYAIALTADGNHLLRWFSLPVSTTYLQQARFIHNALSGATVTANLDQAPLPEANLQRVRGADVMLMFVESYGATAFDESRFRATLKASRKSLINAIDQSGLRVASAFVTSPTIGGASWLAHSSLMSGIEIRDAPSYAMLLTRDRDTLAHRFAKQGYRTVALMPGLKQSWPEGRFYAFDHIYGEQALDYRGPAFGWWRIPDQFALAKLDAMEFRPDRSQPLFVFFPTISTHMPFRPIPPYQRDWSRMLNREPFDADSVRQSHAVPATWSNPHGDYAEALAYGLTNIAGYLTKYSADKSMRRDLILVLLGDHQPPASVSGKAASHDVPIHIITARTDIIKALGAAGFESGLHPPRRSLMPMHQLTPLLLEVFSAPPAMHQ